MPRPFVIIFGKAVRSVARLRGGGSALPGLFVEKISPRFVADTLAQLPRGVVVITGTNGKTTTTKMVTSLLESQGLRVFTNRTGSNFVRGVAAALLGEMNTRGKLTADIAVLELDEAHAVKFTEVIAPTHSLFLNVMRDQLDRFGEIDATARLLEKVALATTENVVLNREDNRIRNIAEKSLAAKVRYFGLSKEVRGHFPNDDELHHSPKNAEALPDARVVLSSLSQPHATLLIDKKKHDVILKVAGAYNIYNAAGALTLVQAILPDAPLEKLLAALADVTPAFGRGESIIVGGQPLELVLVKNPSGFRLGLSSFTPEGYATMIAINDSYADGRDMSWLWDVDFTSLPRVEEVSGVRAYDMTLRLQYDEVPVLHTEPDLSRALRHFIQEAPSSPKRIYCTYTAMMSLRKELSRITEVEEVS